MSAVDDDSTAVSMKRKRDDGDDDGDDDGNGALGSAESSSSSSSSNNSSSSSSSAKKLKAEKLKGIGEGTDSCPYIIMIPPEKVGQVIGRGGATVSEIKVKSGAANIAINQNFQPGVYRQIALTGSPEVIRLV